MLRRNCHLLALAFLAITTSGQNQNFTVDSGVAAPDAAVLVGVTFDSLGSNAVSSGTLEFAYDTTELDAVEQCRSRVGGTVFSTHRVSCSVNEVTGLISVSFTSLTVMVRQLLIGRYSLGAIELSRAPSATASGSRVDYPLTLVSASFRDVNDALINSSDSSEMGQAIFITGWPVDEFEIDDTPFGASNLSQSTISTSPSFVAEQLHSIDSAADEDWILHVRTSDLPLSPRFEVLSLNEFPPSSFHPLVEFYTVDRLVDASIPPVAVFGDCAGPRAEITEMTDEFLQSRLIRVTNCVEPPPEGVSYLFRRVMGLASISGSTLVLGRVTNANTGFPVSLFVITDSNRIGVSSPVDGDYAISVLANQVITLSVASDLHTAQPFVIGPLEPETISENNDFQVVRSVDEIFANSFE